MTGGSDLPNPSSTLTSHCNNGSGRLICKHGCRRQDLRVCAYQLSRRHLYGMRNSIMSYSCPLASGKKISHVYKDKLDCDHLLEQLFTMKIKGTISTSIFLNNCRSSNHRCVMVNGINNSFIVKWLDIRNSGLLRCHVTQGSQRGIRRGGIRLVDLVRIRYECSIKGM